MKALNGPFFVASVGQMVLAMMGMFFTHHIVCIVHVFLLTPGMPMAVIMKITPTMDMLVAVQPVSMMKILLISC